jgi:hypothetical protein
MILSDFIEVTIINITKRGNNSSKGSLYETPKINYYYNVKN